MASRVRRVPVFSAIITAAAARAYAASSIGDVFVLSFENHNWTQPDGNISNPNDNEQIYGNPAAPFINSLVNGNGTITINGIPENVSAQTAFTSTYYNATVNESNVQDIHPSLPNYIWTQAGTNFGVNNDDPPYTSSGAPDDVQTSNQNFAGLLQSAGISWKEYAEDTDINTTTGAVLPQSQWTVPLNDSSGNYSGTNPYNGTNQYYYMVHHDPFAYFTDTNGNGNTTASNPEVSHYAPLQQLQTDLANNTVARYNWITPDAYNNMHTELPNGFTYNGTTYTGDAANIAQGDNFLSKIIPEIMSSSAYQNNGAIVIWFDESEPDSTSNNPDSLDYTLPCIVISPLAHPNVNGSPYDSTIAEYTHSSDLLTMQEIFGVAGNTSTGALGDAANATSLADLFQPGVIPNSILGSSSLTWANASGNQLWDNGASSNWTSGNTTTVFSAGDSVTFNDSNNGNYTVSLSTTVNAASISVNNSAGNYSIAGTGQIIDTGSFTKCGSGALTLGTALTAANLTISAGTFKLAANTTNITLNSLSIPGGTLDVNNNHLLLTYTSSDPIASIAAYIKSGYNNGHWNGPGIISSAAATNRDYGLGWADGKDGVVSGLSSGQIEIKYTLLGDANLDGVVNGTDFSILAANFGKGLTNWDQGNFLYGPSINGSDFSALAANFGQGNSGADATVSPADIAALDAFAAANGLPLPAIVDVPEPASFGLITIGSIAVLSCRRRRTSDPQFPAFQHHPGCLTNPSASFTSIPFCAIAR